MRVKQALLLFLLALDAAGSFADPGGYEQDASGGMRASMLRFTQVERSEAVAQPPQMLPQSDRHASAFAFPEGASYDIPKERAGPGYPSDALPRKGRLSPEERRALRRQIGEVGHDIYTPRH